MNLIQFITVVLLSMGPSYGDREPWDLRTQRMEIVAKAIDDASAQATCSDAYAVETCKRSWPGSKRELALLLVTKGYWESRFAKNVHEGKCRPYECDAATINGNIIHRARSPWQIQRTGLVSKEEYAKMKSASLESTTMAAVVATRHLAVGMAKCRTIPGAISIYGGAGNCNWKGSAGRYKFFKDISARSEADFAKRVDQQRERLEARLNREEKTAKK